MGARAGGGAGMGSYERKQSAFRQGLADLQSQLDASRKAYFSIKKQFPQNPIYSTGYAALQIMKSQGLKTPDEIRQQINDYSRNFKWY